jgi:shikimate kinase
MGQGDERNVYLIGQAGVGKTAIGHAAAERLGWAFFDMDAEVERFFGKDLDALRSELLTDHSYRDAMVEGLLSFAKKARRAVIAISSDCVRVRRGWKLMHQSGVVVHLYADPAEVNERCPIYIGKRELSAAEKKRRHKSLLRQGISLYKYHRPFYERADHTLDITGLGIEDAARGLEELVSRVTLDPPSITP